MCRLNARQRGAGVEKQQGLSSREQGGHEDRSTLLSRSGEATLKSMTLPAISLVVALLVAIRPADGEERSFSLGVPQEESPGSYSLVLMNTGTQSAVFSLQINDRGFYPSTAAVVSNIQIMADEYPGEAPYRKAWRFVRDNSYNCWPSAPLTGLLWQHEPSLFLNSLGFGFCDDAAAISYQLWERMGYKARVWALSGHVVPEVYVDGRWEMLDASFGVFYYNTNGNVAGVEELARQPELITRPIHPINPITNECYSAGVADRYATTRDNSVESWYMTNEPDQVLAFELPPNSRLSVPIPTHRRLKVVDGAGPPRRYANAELEIPAGWRGPIHTALVIQSIEGRNPDTVWIQGQSFTVGSEQLQEFIDQRAGNTGEFFCDLSFTPLQHAVRIRYLVNPLVLPLAHDNRIRLRGAGLSGITAALCKAQVGRAMPMPDK